MNEKLCQAQPPEANADLPEYFRPVANRFGRPMFELVMGSGLAREAVGVLAQANQRVPALLNATGQLAQAYNTVSQMLVESEGWSAEMLGDCEREIKLAWAGRILVPESNIIVTH